jgi:hypothetical protein
LFLKSFILIKSLAIPPVGITSGTRDDDYNSLGIFNDSAIAK